MKSENIKEIIAIGDVHGLDRWKDVVKRHPVAHIVFMGDYCDPYKGFARSTLVNNLKEIISLKNSDPGRITLLLGNHDAHYFTEDIPRGSRYDTEIAEELRKLFNSNMHLFCNAWQYGNLLFTHAGISQYWIDKGLCHNISPDYARCLNNPKLLGNNPKSIYDCGYERGGSSHFGGIFWADIRELNKLPKGMVQVAGHNRVREITHMRSYNAAEGEAADIYVCDCLWAGLYLKIEINGSEMLFYQMSLDGEEDNILLKKDPDKPHDVYI